MTSRLSGKHVPNSEAPEEVIIEGALFESGRPVLVVPYIQKTGIKLDRVMVCWDGSRNAARAVADALPLLRRAGAVEVVTINSVERRNEVAGADIAEHLARHGLKIELKSITDKDERRREHDFEPRRGQLRRPRRDGRLRSLAAARIRSRRRDARNAPLA